MQSYLQQPLRASRPQDCAEPGDGGCWLHSGSPPPGWRPRCSLPGSCSRCRGAAATSRGCRRVHWTTSRFLRSDIQEETRTDMEVEVNDFKLKKGVRLTHRMQMQCFEAVVVYVSPVSRSQSTTITSYRCCSRLCGLGCSVRCARPSGRGRLSASVA